MRNNKQEDMWVTRGGKHQTRREQKGACPTMNFTSENLQKSQETPRWELLRTKDVMFYVIVKDPIMICPHDGSSIPTIEGDIKYHEHPQWWRHRYSEQM